MDSTPDKEMQLSGKAMDRAALEKKIIDLIVSKLDTGERMPTEIQMAKDFGVSRAYLREILRAYEACGIITAYHGNGRYASMPDIGTQITDTWSIILRAKPSMLLDLLEIRSLLEIHSLEKAMNRIDYEQLQLLDEQVKKMSAKAAAGESFVKEDREFHQILFNSTGNVLLQQLLTGFWDLYESSHVSHSNKMETVLQHGNLLKALIKKDLPMLIKASEVMFADARYAILRSNIEEKVHNKEPREKNT